MSVAETVIALIEGLTPEQIRRMPLARRQRFAAICRHWASIADGEPKTPEQILKDAAAATSPKSGVIPDIRRSLARGGAHEA